MEFIFWLLVFLTILATLLALFYLVPFIWGAPFDPTHKKELKTIIRFAKVKKNEKIAELGSGDGRIVIELAKKGAVVHGFEINPFLVWYSKRKIKRLKLQSNAKIHWKNFWKTNLSYYDTVVLFQFHTIMKKLEEKIKKECKKKVKIISSTWKFPTLKLVKTSGRVRMYKN